MNHHCRRCDVAWDGKEACWCCGRVGTEVYTVVNTGLDYAWNWGFEDDPLETMSWVGLV